MAGTPLGTCSQGAVPGSFGCCNRVTRVLRLQSSPGSGDLEGVIDTDDWKIVHEH